jgi:hypothetical protein
MLKGGSMIKRILNLYFSPVETFKAVNEKPDWIVPISLSIVVILIMTTLAMPGIIIPDQMKRIEEMERLPEEAKAIQLERLQGALPYITTPVSIIIFSFILLFLQSGIFVLVFLILGNRTNFKKMLAVVSYSYLTGIPEIILKVVLMFVKKTARVYTSLVLVFPNLDVKSPLFKVLSRLDIFMIWHLALIALGCSIIYGVSRKKSFGIIFGLWALWLIVIFIASYFMPKGLQFG